MQQEMREYIMLACPAAPCNNLPSNAYKRRPVMVCGEQVSVKKNHEWYLVKNPKF
jgi:hypothetical protein